MLMKNYWAPLLLVMISPILFAQTSIKQLLPADYQKATEIVSKNKSVWEKALHSPDMMLAVVFPEIIRYSHFRNLIETSALELAYVEWGAGQADFSIGYFQMKPSFAEKVEKAILDSFPHSEWATMFSYPSSNEKKIREERLKRLKDSNWQLHYLNAFDAIMKLKYPNDTIDSERVILLASAYNRGFEKPLNDMMYWGKLKIFPFGTSYPGKQFGYADIALEFFQELRLTSVE